MNNEFEMLFGSTSTEANVLHVNVQVFEKISVYYEFYCQHLISNGVLALT